MKYFLKFFMVIGCAQLCANMELAIKPLATLIDTIVPEVNQMYNDEAKELSAFQQYESGNVVNVLGETQAVVNLLTATLNRYSKIKGFVFQFIDIIYQQYVGQASTSFGSSRILKSVSGPTFSIPNVAIGPFINLANGTKNDLSNIESCIETVDNTLKDRIMPLIQQNLQTNGILLVPATIGNTLRKNLYNIIDILEQMAKNIKNAATQSTNNKSTENFQAGITMGQFNSIGVTVSNKIDSLTKNVKTIMDNLEIISVAGNQDQINTVQVLRSFHKFLLQISDLMSMAKDMLGLAQVAVHMIQNPFINTAFKQL